jgi:hypothetical protein
MANLGDGQESGRLEFFGNWIDPSRHGDELLVGKDTGLLDGHQTIAPNNDPPRASLWRPILDYKALEARRHDLHSEASELPIPYETLPNLDPNLRRFRRLEGIHDALGEPFFRHLKYQDGPG